MQKTIAGWAFHTADFSIQAATGGNCVGSVTLTRDFIQKQRWHRLSEGEQEAAPLYICGTGLTLQAAIADAEHRASLLPLLELDALKGRG